MNSKYDITFPANLLKSRIGHALTDLNLNEFYNAFKYLKSVIVEIFENKDDSKECIKNSIKNISLTHGSSEQTIMTGIHNIYDKCNKELLKEEIPKGRIKLNYLERIRIVANYVITRINYEN